MAFVGTTLQDMVLAVDTTTNVWVAQKPFESTSQGKSVEHFAKIQSRMDAQLQCGLKAIEASCSDIQQGQHQLDLQPSPEALEQRLWSSCVKACESSPEPGR